MFLFLNILYGCVYSLYTYFDVKDYEIEGDSVYSYYHACTFEICIYQVIWLLSIIKEKSNYWKLGRKANYYEILLLKVIIAHKLTDILNDKTYLEMGYMFWHHVTCIFLCLSIFRFPKSIQYGICAFTTAEIGSGLYCLYYLFPGSEGVKYAYGYGMTLSNIASVFFCTIAVGGNPSVIFWWKVAFVVIDGYLMYLREKSIKYVLYASGISGMPLF